MNVQDMLREYHNNKTGDNRGTKECPDCNQRVGVRSFTCKHCGYKFTNKQTKTEQRQEEDAPTEEEMLYARSIGAPGGRLVYAGAGSPPARLSDINSQSVSDYCNLVVHAGIQNGVIYTTDAIKKYIQHQFGYESKFYKRACELVDQWYDEKMGVDTPSGDEYNESL